MTGLPGPDAAASGASKFQYPRRRNATNLGVVRHVFPGDLFLRNVIGDILVVARQEGGPLTSDAPYIPGSDPDLWLYRDRTLGMLRRYSRLSVEVGWLPSLLGREFFRSRVTSYRAGTLEDAVIFVHNVARRLAKLGSFDHKLIARIVLQDYTHNETARLLGCWRCTVGRRFPEAVDQLTDIFLEADLLVRLPATDVAREKICQEGKKEESPVSDSGQGE